MELKHLKFKLPLTVITLNDVSKVITELDELDNFFTQMNVGKIAKTTNLPHTSNALEEMVRLNEVNLLNKTHREKLKLILQSIRTKAPTLHMSFSGEPSNIFMEKVITWVRSNINPLTLIQIGLQPNIGAGFTLRTNNKFFNFSLREHLEKNTKVLIEQLTKGTDL